MTVYNKISAPSIILIIVFLMTLCLPLMDSFLGISSKENYSENRQLASQPKFDINDLDHFTPDYNTYYSDNFNFRNDLIKLHSNFKFNVLGISPFPKKVAQGKNGWLYDAGVYMDYYRCKEPFSASQLEEFQNILEYRYQWLESKGINYYLVVVPVKANVYPEYLPDFVYKLRSNSKLDQLIGHLDDHSSFRLIDLRKNLFRHKNINFLYHKTDTHWNDLGAFYGASAIIDSIQNDFSILNSYNIADYQIDTSSINGKVLASMLNMNDKIRETEIKLTPKFEKKAHGGKPHNYPIPESFPYKPEFQLVNETDNDELPKALIVRDSFTNAMKKYLRESFNRTVFIWDNWEYGLNKHIVETEKPDIVITIVVEKSLHNILEHASEEEKQGLE